MLKIKNFTVAIASLLLCGNAFAQEVVPEQDIVVPQNSKLKERIIYLWDVTISMYGFVDGGKPINESGNIYEKVQKSLVKDINNIPNSETEIYIVAFRGPNDKKSDNIVENALNEYGYYVWSGLSDPAGKKKLTDIVEKTEFEVKKNKNNGLCMSLNDQPNKGHTNTYTALRYAMDSLFSKDAVNYVKILTDGRIDDYHMYSFDNEKKTQKDHFCYALKNWCEYANKNNVYAYFINLTPSAGEDNKEYKDKTRCRFHFIDDISSIEEVRQITLRNETESQYNLLNDEGKSIVIKADVALGDKNISDGFYVKCKTGDGPGSPFVIDGDFKFNSKDKTIELKPDFGEFAYHKLPAGKYELVLDVAPSTKVNADKFKYVTIENGLHTVVLKNEEQVLQLDTKSYVCNVRESTGEIKVKFKTNLGKIKPGFRVKYRCEYTDEFSTPDKMKLFKVAEGEAELDENCCLTIVPQVDKSAKDPKVLNPKNNPEDKDFTQYKCAEIIFESAENEEYKNVRMEEKRCGIYLINKTFRTVKIRYAK